MPFSLGVLKGYDNGQDHKQKIHPLSLSMLWLYVFFQYIQINNQTFCLL